jgi:hypothetical protein
MAVVTVNAPELTGSDTEDLDIFIANYLGHLNTLGINPMDEAGAPPGWRRAMGVLRSCMKGEAARWFDQEITGKNWELSHILFQTANANPAAAGAIAAFVALNVPEGGGGPNINTYVRNTPANDFATAAGNALVTIRNAFMPARATVLLRNLDVDVQWRRAGGRPTDSPANGLNALGRVHIVGQPIVLPEIRPDQALAFMREQFPSVINERRRTRFNSLYQDYDEPIRTFYKKVKRGGKLLHLTDELINDQFFRGILPDIAIEADRLGDVDMERLLTGLEKIERRKNEIRTGLQR